MRICFTNDGSQAIVTLTVAEAAIFDRAKPQLTRFEGAISIGRSGTDKIAYVSNGEGGEIAVVDTWPQVIRRPAAPSPKASPTSK
jgi:hypothetical protein